MALAELQPQSPDYYKYDNDQVRRDVQTNLATYLATAPAQVDIENEVRAVVDSIESQKDKVDDVASQADKYTKSIRGDVETIAPQTFDDAKQARRSLITLFEIIRAQDSGNFPQTSVMDQKSRDLISAIDRKIDNDLSESSAIVLFPLINRLAQSPIALTKDQLEEEFDKMQGRMAKSTLAKIGKAVVDRHTDYGYATATEAEERFVNNVVDPLRDNLQNVNKPLTASEQAKYDYYLDFINKNYPPAVVTDANERERLTKKIWADIKKKDKAEVLRQLGPFGWKDTHVDELFSLNRDVLIPKRGDDILSDYGISPEDLVVFDPNHINSNFVKYFNNESGVWRVNEHFKAELVRTLYENVNKILQKASADPNSDWKDHFNDLVEGRAVRELKDRLTAIADDKRLIAHFGGDEISKRALRDMILNTANEIDMEISVRETLHTLGGIFIYNRAGTKDIAGFLKARFPASTIAYILNAFRGPFVELARAKSIDYVKESIRENNGVISPALLGGVFDPKSRYGHPDRKSMRDEYIEELKQMKNDKDLMNHDKEQRELYDLLQEPMEEWMYEREMALGLVLAFIDMGMIEALLTAQKSPSFAGGLTEFLGPWFPARIEKGDFLFEAPGVLATKVARTESQRKARRAAGHHNPLTYYRQSKNLDPRDVSYDTVGKDSETGISFANAIRDIVPLSLAAEKSWRNDSLKYWYRLENNGKALGSDWRKTYSFLLRNAGVGVLWGFDEERVKSEVKGVRLESRYPGYKDKYTSAQIDVLWANMNRSEYWKPMSSEELKWERFTEQKTVCYQGMNFEATLRRAPGDWLDHMAVLEPEILTTKKDKDGKTISAYDFYFDKDTKLNDIAKKDRDTFLKKLELRWGKENKEHVGRVMEYWRNTYAYYAKIERDKFVSEFRAEKGRDPNKDEIEENKLYESGVKIGRKRTYQVLGAALGSVKAKNKPEMNKDDMGGDNPSAEQEFFIKQLFMEDGGLQHYFHTKNKETFGEKDGEEGKLGNKKFFYAMASRWWHIERRKRNPSTSDIKLKAQYDNIAQLGETPIFRIWDDIEAYSTALKALPIYDQLLRAEANGNPKPMAEFLGGIKELAGKKGNEGMWQIMWTMIFPELEFFQRTGHGIIDPFFNSLIASDSKMVFGSRAGDMVSEEIRVRLQEYVKAGYLPDKGPFSAESMMKVLRVDDTTYMLAEVIPTSMLIIIFMYLGQQLKKAYAEEFELSQKKAA